MLKLTVAFFLGAIVVSAAVVATGASAAGFVALGAGLAVFSLAVIGYITGARRLASFFAWLDSDRKPRSNRVQAAIKRTAFEPGSVGDQLVTALRNLSTPRADALRAVREAIDSNPGADFGRLFNVSVGIARKMAA